MGRRNEKESPKKRAFPHIRMDRIEALKELSNQVQRIENQIREISGRLYAIETAPANEKPASNSEGRFTEAGRSNIIPFPVSFGSPVSSEFSTRRRAVRFSYQVPILAKPGEPLPASIPDFRLSLQRDGLILLSWVKRHTEMGERYTAYWVTSQGINRYYASGALEAEHFVSAVPAHKSYAAEDGIEFYGQDNPAYVVHVAPDLMISRRQAEDNRPEHIKKLRTLGMKADYSYRFLLTRERRKPHPLVS
jgi:hypothetical protein